MDPSHLIYIKRY